MQKNYFSFCSQICVLIIGIDLKKRQKTHQHQTGLGSWNREWNQDSTSQDCKTQKKIKTQSHMASIRKNTHACCFFLFFTAHLQHTGIGTKTRHQEKKAQNIIGVGVGTIFSLCENTHKHNTSGKADDLIEH